MVNRQNMIYPKWHYLNQLICQRVILILRHVASIMIFIVTKREKRYDLLFIAFIT